MAILHKLRSGERDSHDCTADFAFIDGKKNPDVQIFSCPKPARKFVQWKNMLLVATDGGFFRVDGNRMEAFLTVADGLPSNSIRDAVVSGRNLFAGTDNGLCIIEPSGKTTIIHHRTSQSANRINSLALSSPVLLFATDDGAYLLRGTKIFSVCDTGKYVAATQMTNGFILAANNGDIIFANVDTAWALSVRLKRPYSLLNSNGRIFVATGLGAFSFDLGSSFVDYVASEQRLTTAVSGTADSLWVAGLLAAELIKDGKKTYSIDLPSSWGNVCDIIQYGGKILLCGYGGIIDENGKIFDFNAPPENRIMAVVEYSKSIWVGTFSSGLASFDGVKWNVPDIDIPSPFINSLATDGRFLWVGTDAGLVRIGGQTQVFKKRDGLNSDNITALSFDGNALWVGTSKGVCRRESFGWRQFYVSDGLCGDHIYAVSASREEAWVAAYGGVTRLSPMNTKCFRRADGALLNDWATAIVLCDDGVFVGTYGGGISRYFDGKWEHFERGTIINPSASALFYNCPIFGTAGSGLLIWDGLRFRRVTMTNGLPSNEILSILPGDEYIWIGTPSGLAKIRADRFIH